MSASETIEVGDTVKVIADGTIAKTIDYMSGNDTFRLQIGNSPVPYSAKKRDELELVSKPKTSGGPGFYPATTIMDG